MTTPRSKLTDKQRARLLKALKQADDSNVPMGDLIRVLSPLYGRSQVQRFIREVRDKG